MDKVSKDSLEISFTLAVIKVVSKDNGNCHHNVALIAKEMKKEKILILDLDIFVINVLNLKNI